MKKLLKISLFSILALGLFSCEEDNDALTGNENEGGLVDVATQSLVYSQGQATTDMLNSSFSVFQGREVIESVDVYKVFYGKINVGTPNEAIVASNKALLKTVNFTDFDQYVTSEIEYNYNDLISGLTFNGAPMPASDATLNIGDYWVLTYVSNLTNGATHVNTKLTTIKIACGSYLEGNYNLVVTITAGSGTGNVYNMPGEVLTNIGGTRYKANSIGPYNDRGLISSGAQIAGVGLVFDDVCGELQLWKDPTWADNGGDTGIPLGTAQRLGNYYNPVYQTPALITSSTVNPITGVITIDYNIWFSAGTRTYRNVYTPQ